MDGRSLTFCTRSRFNVALRCWFFQLLSPISVRSRVKRRIWEEIRRLRTALAQEGHRRIQHDDDGRRQQDTSFETEEIPMSKDSIDVPGRIPGVEPEIANEHGDGKGVNTKRAEQREADREVNHARHRQSRCARRCGSSCCKAVCAWPRSARQRTQAQGAPIGEGRRTATLLPIASNIARSGQSDGHEAGGINPIGRAASPDGRGRVALQIDLRNGAARAPGSSS